MLAGKVRIASSARPSLSHCKTQAADGLGVFGFDAQGLLKKIDRLLALPGRLISDAQVASGLGDVGTQRHGPFAMFDGFISPAQLRPVLRPGRYGRRKKLGFKAKACS